MGPVTISKTLLIFIVVFVVALVLAIVRADIDYTSVWDEHTHLSYVQYAWQGIIPANGYPMNTWAKDAFSCHPHMLYGPMTAVPCGVEANGSQYPTGGTNTSQAWPPMYFILASLIMRPFQLFVSDPLFAARYATAILWALGVAFLSVIVWKRNHRIEQTLTTGLLLVALPVFGYFSSFVSPHSMNPLIAAGLLAVVFKWIDAFKTESLTQRYVWAAMFVLMSALAAVTVPQSLLIVAIASLFATVSIALELHLSWGKKALSLAGVVGAQAIACGVFYMLYRLWQFSIAARAIPYTSQVDPAGESVDAPQAPVASLWVRLLSRFWSFWPDGLSTSLPSTPTGAAITSGWTFLLLALSIAAVVFWRKSDWISKLMLGLLIAAPIISLAFDIVFTTNVPSRYGLGAAVIGVLAVNNRSIGRPMSRIILAIAFMTYLAAFVLSPVLIEAGVCWVGTDHLVTCVK